VGFLLPRTLGSVVRALLGLAALLGLSAGCARAPGQAPAASLSGAPLVLPEHYAHSIAALGMPGARRAFQVGHGSVVGNGDAALEWRLAPEAGPVRVSPVYFERDGVPVAHWWMVSARESIHFEAAAVSRAALGDSNLMLSVLATCIRTDPSSGDCALEVRVRARPEGPVAIPWDAEDTDVYQEWWRDRFAMRNGRLVAGIDPTITIARDAPRPGRAAETHGAGPGALFAIARAHLGRGERRSWHFWMPVYPSAAPGAALERIADHGRVVSDARRTWRAWLAKGASLTTPDSLLEGAWRAALVTLLVSHERDGDTWVPLGNPFQYRDVWLRDAARTVRALAVAGYADIARSDALTLTRFQLPNGVLLSQQGQLDGTGQGVWALAQAASLPPAPEWATQTVPVARRALAWYDLQRALTQQLQIRYAGLLSYTDPRDNELTRAQLVGNDAWGIAGCRAAGALARLAGNDSLARAADAAAVDYHAAFRTALARSGSPDVPPSWQGVGRDWGNLAAGYPTQALELGDARLAGLARRVWSRSGGPGLIHYGSLDTLHSYVGADLAQWALLSGRADEARAYLADLLAHSSSTLGQAELFSRTSGGFGTNLPPHATAAASLVDLMRNMVVCDARDTLELALGGDARTWSGTRFEHAPTRFGVIDVALERPANDMRRARWSAVAVPTRVRVPDGERVVEVLTPGARAVGESWVVCASQTREVEFRVAPNPRGSGGAPMGAPGSPAP
jgi:hypothetical protein